MKIIQIIFMQNRILSLVFVIIYISVSYVFAQKTDNLSQSIPRLASFPVVYGWYQDNNDKWTSKNNEIKNIDKFEKYCIASILKNGIPYVIIIKEEKHKSESIFNTYVLDYEFYKGYITKWEEHAIIKFPILKHHQARVKKGQALTEEILGINDLSDILRSPRDYFVFQYKFFPDSTVKFLFYVEQCTLDSCFVSGLDTKAEYTDLYKYIGTDGLYDNFFYKTTIKYFTDFTDFPFK